MFKSVYVDCRPLTRGEIVSNPQQASRTFGTEISLLLDDLQELNVENLGFIQMMRTAPLTPVQWAKRDKNMEAIKVLMARIDALGSQ